MTDFSEGFASDPSFPRRRESSVRGESEAENSTHSQQKSTPNVSIEPSELQRIQHWMQAVIMHPEGVAAGIESPESRSVLDVAIDQVESVIHRSTAQTSIERLDIYANAYYARLLEVLAAEFPALVHALGEKLFQEFAFGYLQQYPSQSYTLSELSAKFPEYLARTRPVNESADTEPDWADFLVDLATLERTYSDVFDGRGVEGQQLLNTDELREITLDRWPGVRLVPVPCLRLLRLRFAVHEYASAVRRKENPELSAPSPTWLVVTRRNYVVRRIAIDETEFLALAALVGGGSIADSLNAAQDRWSGDVDQLATEVQRWFRDWSAAGYFLRTADDSLDP